jgi:hypothetical protein
MSIVDEECDIALASLAQFLLHANKVPEALRAFEKAAELSRTEMEIVNALQYAEAVRTQLEVCDCFWGTNFANERRSSRSTRNWRSR